MKNIILASKSPRRTEILNKFGINHQIETVEVEEIKEGNPIDVVKTNAFLKGKPVSDKNPTSIVISADTIVVINNEILGKPKDLLDAKRMLSLLSGKTHQVITAVSIFFGDYVDNFAEITDVVFKNMTENDINIYISNDYVLDKAGAYAVQSENATFIKEFIGSYYNVVGLPIEKVLEHLKKVDCQ